MVISIFMMDSYNAGVYIGFWIIKNVYWLYLI